MLGGDKQLIAENAPSRENTAAPQGCSEENESAGLRKGEPGVSAGRDLQ